MSDLTPSQRHALKGDDQDGIGTEKRMKESRRGELAQTVKRSLFAESVKDWRPSLLRRTFEGRTIRPTRMNVHRNRAPLLRL